MTTAFWVCTALLYYVYDGYLRLLRVVNRFHRAPSDVEGRLGSARVPTVTVLVTAYNEQHEIAARIENLLSLDYPADAFEIVVASDGSTDHTDDIVRGFADRRVRLYRPALRRGKTATQNQALRQATGEIVVFTDAETRFDRQFLQQITAPFADESVGAVDCRLTFVSAADSAVAESTGFYWKYELALRTEESCLGLLTVMSGAGLAVRRELLRPLEEHYGEDCLIPLDVALQGRRIVHASQALARDRADQDTAQAFQNRVRMTLRNWQGTWSRWSLLMPWRHPGYAFALWSHKLLRWLSPFWVLGSTMSALALSVSRGGVWWLPAALVFLAHAAAAAGFLADRAGVRLPVASAAYSFAIANLAFLVGVTKALTGRRINAYRQSSAGHAARHPSGRAA